MNKTLKTIFLFILLIGNCVVFCQEQIEEDILRNKASTNYYTLLSVGFTNPIYRDFATSPLFYTGAGIDLSSAWLKRADSRERIFEGRLQLSALLPRVPKSNLIQSGSIAAFGSFHLFYQELWKLAVFSDNINNTKVGGALIITQNIRGNPGLQNNALGLENISNLMASAQWTRDISRTEIKQLNFGFWKPVLNPVKRDLRFLLNVGVLNFNYRPGYAYAYDSELNGMETNPVEWAFSNYKWSLNGWRLITQLEYIKYLPNGNARSWSYIWEAAHTPGKFEAFQMASHQLRYTIYFNTKTR